MATTAAEWLQSNRDYTTGLEILRSSGTNTFTLQLLSSGPDAFNTPKLLKELEKLAAAQPVNPVTKISEKVTKEQAAHPVAQSSSTPIRDKDLERKLATDRKILEIWKEICHLHGQLSTVAEGAQLHGIARQIMLANLKKQRLFDDLHYYQANGYWFDDLPENQDKTINLQQEIKNAMANRSKAKRYLTRPLPAFKKTYYEGIVANWDTKIAQLIQLRDGKQESSTQGAA